MTAKTLAGLARPGILVAGILLIAANLRAPITGVAPVLDMIREAFALSTAEAGVLTTLPLVVFAVASPFCALLARKYGLERSLCVALVLIGTGVVVRSLGPVWALFGGTGIIGLGIAIANVLLPSLLKRDFPDRITSLTSAYALTAGVIAALASTTAVPIAKLPGSGWNWALGSLLLFPLLGLVAWTPQLSGHSAPTADTASPPHGGRVWRSILAWQVTLFFGLNSLVYYTTVTWLPAILVDAGFTPATAGSLHGVSQLATAIPGLFLGPLVKRLKDQKAVAVGIASLTIVSLAGLLLAPAWALLWSAMFGFGAGGTFILALAFISLRVGNPAQAAALSGMAQSVGYTIAAAAPPLGGLLHQLTGSWAALLVGCAALAGLIAACGYRAGRAARVE